MIFDNINNAGLYEGISANLKIALDYMKENDLSKMEPGRYPIADGKVLVIIKKDYSTKDLSLAKWESHKRDIDIQYLLAGEEKIGYCSTKLLEVKEEYDEKSDKILYHNDDFKGFMTHLRAGDYLILFPEDAHATLFHPAEGQPCICSKAVIKVAID